MLQNIPHENLIFSFFKVREVNEVMQGYRCLLMYCEELTDLAKVKKM